MPENLLGSLLIHFMLEDFPRIFLKRKYLTLLQSKLIYVKEWSQAPFVVVVYMVCFMIVMCTLLVVNSFVNLKRC